MDKHRGEVCVLPCAACSCGENGVHVCLSESRMGNTVGAASNPPLCSQACVGDNVDNEGGILARGAVRAHSHSHTNTHTPTQALTQKAVAALETPQALQCVCVCLCYSWPAGTSGSE